MSLLNTVVSQGNAPEKFTMASVQKYILAQRPENTVIKTEYDLHVWKRFFFEVGEARKIEDTPADELKILICRFLMEVKKKDGGAYEPATLQSFQRSLQRYLNDKNSKLNILKDQEFLKSREVLLSNKKQLVFDEAKGNRPHAAKELDPALKKTCCFAPVNLATKTPKHSSAHCGGYWHYTLDSVPETKAESSNGETLFFTQTTKRATKF